MHKEFNFSGAGNLISTISSLLRGQGWKTPTGKFFQKEGFECRLQMTSHNGTGKRGMANYTPSGQDNRAYGASFTLFDRYGNEITSVKKNLAICGSVLDYHTGKGTTEHAENFVGGVGLAIKQSGKAWINYSEEPTLSCTVTIKLEMNGLKFYQHVSFGDIIKASDFEGGAYLSASRSMFALFPQEWTSYCILATSVPLFSMSEYPSSYVYAIYDGSNDPNNMHHVNFITPSNEILRENEKFHQDRKTGYYYVNPALRNGTGKKLGTSVSDCAFFGKTPQIPTYKNMQSNYALDYNKCMNIKDGIATLLPIYLFAEREPVELGNYSYIGKIPNAYFTSIANMADESIHQISIPVERREEQFQVFPQTIRCGRHGYDGVAVKYDEKDYSDN